LKTLCLSVAACFSFFALAVVFAQSSQPDTNLTVNPVFQKECAKCHGKAAEGRHFHGPSLISEKIAAASPGDLHDIIANGKHHMPKFDKKLTPEEIDNLVHQIEALNKTKP
jgi:mono/diheme cytochrome c family protein